MKNRNDKAHLLFQRLMATSPNYKLPSCKSEVGNTNATQTYAVCYQEETGWQAPCETLWCEVTQLLVLPSICLLPFFVSLVWDSKAASKDLSKAELVGNLELWYDIIFVLGERSDLRSCPAMLVLLLNLQEPWKSKPRTLPASSGFKNALLKVVTLPN